MLIRTTRPVIEQEPQSNIGGSRQVKKVLKKGSGKKGFGEKLKGGFGKFRDAGGVDLITNLISNKNSPSQSAIPEPVAPPMPPVKEPMKTSTKVIIGVLIVSAIIGGFVLYKKSNPVKLK